MVALAPDAVLPEPKPNAFTVDWALISCVTGSMAAAASALLAAFARNAWRLDRIFGAENLSLAEYVLFAIAFILPIAICWHRAISDGQLPARRGAEPQYEHVSGWSAAFLLVVMLVIAWLALWAAGSSENNRKIHAEWGTWTVVGLSIAFVAVAAAPLLPRVVRLLRLESALTSTGSWLTIPIAWIGRFLSGIDGVLVFAVANAVGSNRQNPFLRYAILLTAITTCATLGYYWDAPLAFIPIACGFLIAFSVSRRWAWIEGDRELAMLNPTLSQAHIRVGFSQDLRDESLVVFLSMFLLVPLALRQGQLWADDSHVQLFTLAKGVDAHSIAVWIGFYGTELAKAVPFVDWAEVYHVEGDAPISATAPYALHAIFAVRVLIDLVFLAALLQAISSAQRDSQQRDLFYRKRAITRLDPFTEPEAFRALVRRNETGEWATNGDRFYEFPKYDANRLVELSTNRDERIRRAADLLLERDRVDGEPHHHLTLESSKRDATPDAITAILDDIANAGPERNVYLLALARRRLLGRRAMLEVRKRILRMIAESHAPPNRAERRNALVEAVVGETRETYQQGRRIALDALEPDVGIDLTVRNAFRQVKDHDGAQLLRARATDVLKQHPETPD